MLTGDHNAKYFCRVLHYSRHCVISRGGLPVKGIMAQLPRNVFNRASGHRQVCVQNRARVWAHSVALRLTSPKVCFCDSLGRRRKVLPAPRCQGLCTAS